MTALIHFDGVEKHYKVGRRAVRALDGVTLSVARGSCHAIVGESGSGKTTLGSILLGITPASAGEVRFHDAPLPAARPLALRRKFQLVQQNPASALNPRRSVGASIRLALDVHKIGTPADRKARVLSLLEEVGLEPDIAHRGPGALSGGQRQRVAIARALACDPEVIVLDEPTSALDVLVQARVLELLDRLRRSHNLTYLFITHDLAVVRTIADRVSVMQAGRLVEDTDAVSLFRAPAQPYTRQLIGAIPVVTEEEKAMRDRAAGNAYAALDAEVAERVGHKLFTVLVVDPAAQLMRRIYTSVADAYPEAGSKPIEPGILTDALIHRSETHLTNGAADMAAAFGDNETIASLGCQACVNIPIVVDGQTVALVNTLHEVDWFTPDRVAALEDLVATHRGALLAALNQDQPA